METKTLERLKFAAATHLGGFSARQPQVEMDVSPDDLLLKLCTEVLAERIEDADHTDSFQIPASWWQHWKQDHAPAWFLRRWPVQGKTIELRVHTTRWAKYPRANLTFDKRLGDPVIFDYTSQSRMEGE